MKIDTGKTENKFVEVLLKILVYGVAMSFIAAPILIFYTFDRNLTARHCSDACQNGGCTPIMEGFWCYEWEDCGPIWLPGTQFCCDGSNFSTREACVNDCRLNYCPQKISWKYTIFAGSPMLIYLAILLYLHLGEKMEIFAKNRER